MLAKTSTTGFGASLFISILCIGEEESLVGDHLDGLIPHETLVFIYESMQILVALLCVIVVIDWQFRTLIIDRLSNLDEVVAYAQRMPQQSFFSYNTCTFFDGVFIIFVLSLVLLMFTIMPWFHALGPLPIMIYQGNMRTMFRQTDQVKAMFEAKLAVSDGFVAETHDAPPATLNVTTGNGTGDGRRQLGFQLEKIHELREKGFLSADESEAAKQALLQPSPADTV
jgi:hypothetical protein